MLHDFNNYRRTQRRQFLKMMRWKRRRFYNQNYLRNGSGNIYAIHANNLSSAMIMEDGTEGGQVNPDDPH